MIAFFLRRDYASNSNSYALIPCWTCQVQEFFCKDALLQDTRFTLSRHWRVSFSCRKLGQVSVPRSSLLSYRIVLYGKASEVKRQEIFFLLERGFFCSNRRPNPDAKKKPTSSRRLWAEFHQKSVWCERFLTNMQLHSRQKQHRCSEQSYSRKFV